MQESSPFNLVNLLYYWGVIYRKRHLAIAIGLAVVTVFTLAAFLLPKTYESSATVFIERSTLINPLIQGVGVTVGLDERLRNLNNILTSRNLIERVIKKLNLDAKVKNATQYEGLIDDLKKSLKVTVRSGGDRSADLYFTLAYRGNDPKIVRELVNTHISECITINESSRSQDVYGAFNFIEKELNEYKLKLNASDKHITEFRELHPEMVPQSEHTVAARVENYQSGQIDAEIKLRELEKRRESLKKQLSGEKELTVAFVSRDGSAQGRFDFLNNQLMLLLSKYTDDYPEVIKIKSEMDELQKQMAQPVKQDADQSSGTNSGSEMKAMNPVYRQLKEEMSRTDTEIETLRARQSELARQQQVGQTILRRMPQEQEQWEKLQRERNVYQRIYDDLFNKLESARVSRDLELGEKNTTFRVIDPPIVPHVPISPNKVRLIFLGLFMGVLSGVGAIMALDYIHPSFKSEEHLESELKVPLLASIPEVVTESDRLVTVQLDKKYYLATAIYLAVIGVVLIVTMLTQYLGLKILNL